MRKDDPLAYAEGECFGYLHLWFEYGRRPRPGAVETLVSDYAFKRQTLVKP